VGLVEIQLNTSSFYDASFYFPFCSVFRFLEVQVLQCWYTCLVLRLGYES